mmetsp:Transcript_18186/g.43491  ORF Transcript_18186/g.43491 Transcript_18186/m.43491 type:complete len:160 (+) Transcript_18186:299-778(+)
METPLNRHYTPGGEGLEGGKKNVARGLFPTTPERDTEVTATPPRSTPCSKLDTGAGVGMLLKRMPGERMVSVAFLHPGGPAARSGMMCVGDEVVAVDLEPLEDKAPDDIRKLVRGPPGLPVLLAVRPKEGPTRFVRLERCHTGATSRDETSSPLGPELM